MPSYDILPLRFFNECMTNHFMGCSENNFDCTLVLRLISDLRKKFNLWVNSNVFDKIFYKYLISNFFALTGAKHH